MALTHKMATLLVVGATLLTPSAVASGEFESREVATIQPAAEGDVVWGISTREGSVNTAGIRGNGVSNYADVSASGRFVVFVSWASNLVQNDTNVQQDVFIRDTSTETTRRISVSSDEEQLAEGGLSPTISANGRYVAFHSGGSGILVRDRREGTTLSVAHGIEPSISPDGSQVAFVSSSQLTSRDRDSSKDVFVVDWMQGVTRMVSVRNSGSPADSTSVSPSISQHGRYVSFFSRQLSAADTGEAFDMYVRDRFRGTTEWISVPREGKQSNRDSYSGSISARGRYVAFTSHSNKLTARDTNGSALDVFVRDRARDVTRLVSVNNRGRQGAGSSYDPDLSGDGRWVVFTSDNRLVGADFGDQSDVYIRNLRTHTTKLVSIGNDAHPGGRETFRPALSKDGNHVAFTVGPRCCYQVLIRSRAEAR